MAFFFFKVKLRSWLMSCFMLLSNSDISRKGSIIQRSQQFIVEQDGSLRTYWSAAHPTGEIHLVAPYICQAEGVGTASVIGSAEGRNGGMRSMLFLFDLLPASKEKKIRRTWEGLEQCRRSHLTPSKTPSKFLVCGCIHWYFPLSSQIWNCENDFGDW